MESVKKEEAVMKKQTFKFLALAVSLLTFLGNGNTEVEADELKLTVPLGRIIESDVPSVCGGFGPYPRDIVDMAREILTNFEYQIFTPEAYGDELIYFATGVNENGLNKIDLSMKYLAKIAGIPVANKEDRLGDYLIHFVILLHPDHSIYFEDERFRRLIISTVSAYKEKQNDNLIQKDIALINSGYSLVSHVTYSDPTYRRYLFRTNPDANERERVKYFIAASMDFLFKGLLNFTNAKALHDYLDSIRKNKNSNVPTFYEAGYRFQKMEQYLLKHDRIPPFEESLLRMAYGHDVCVITRDEKALS